MNAAATAKLTTEVIALAERANVPLATLHRQLGGLLEDDVAAEDVTTASGGEDCRGCGLRVEVAAERALKAMTDNSKRTYRTYLRLLVDGIRLPAGWSDAQVHTYLETAAAMAQPEPKPIPPGLACRRRLCTATSILAMRYVVYCAGSGPACHFPWRRAKSIGAAMSGSLTVTNARIFDGWSEDPTEGNLVIVDGVVQDIGPGAEGPGEVLDAQGSVVVPGFIDAHCHAYGVSLDLLGIETSPTSWIALKAARRLRAALRRGFTTVRDVAGGDVGLATAIQQGLLASPRYLYTGPGLSQTGGHGDPRDPLHDSCCRGQHMVEVVDGVDNLRVAVRERLRTGAHAIKVMASGGVVSLADPLRIPQYSSDELRAVVDEATRRGSYVAAHAYSPEAVLHAVGSGIRSIEHGNLLDRESATVMAAASAFLVPTLVTYWAMAQHGESLGMPLVAREKNTEVLEAGQGAIELAVAAGVPVGFGTDLMGDLEDAQLQGLELQHEVQGTLELLRSVTSRNADLIGDDSLGRLRSGSVGDLIVLGGDPFEEPHVLWEPTESRTVVLAGEVVR